MVTIAKDKNAVINIYIMALHKFHHVLSRHNCRYCLQHLQKRKSSFHSNVILCPGQDAHRVGMIGKIDSTNKSMFDICDMSQEVLAYDIIKICNEGPLETLTRTKHCQAAVTVSSIIGFEKLRRGNQKNFKVDFAAGFSVGEIPALFIAQKCSLKDVFELIKSRADAMDRGCRLKETGMVALQGLSFEQAEEVCHDLNRSKDDKDHVLSIAIKRYAKAVTIGGSFIMLNKMLNKEHLLLQNDSVEVTKVNVDGAFHTDYMQPALGQFEETLSNITFNKSDTKVFSNVTGEVYKNDELKELLLLQIVKPVLWGKVMDNLNSMFIENNLLQFYEVGGGKTLKAMAGKVNRKLLKNFSIVS